MMKLIRCYTDQAPIKKIDKKTDVNCIIEIDF